MSVLIDVGRTWLKQTFAWSNTRRAWVDRLAGSGLIVCFVLLAWFSRRLSTTQLVLSFAGLAALAAFMLRRGWIHLFGPILFYDLVRTASAIATLSFAISACSRLWGFFSLSIGRPIPGILPTR